MVLLACLFGALLVFGADAQNYENLKQDNEEIVVELTVYAGQVSELLRNIVLLAKVSVKEGLKPTDFTFEPPASEGWRKTAIDYLASLDHSYKAFREVYSVFVDIQRKLLLILEDAPDDAEEYTTEPDITSEKILSKRKALDTELPNHADELEPTKEQISKAQNAMVEALENYIETQFGEESMSAFKLEDSEEISVERGDVTKSFEESSYITENGADSSEVATEQSITTELPAAFDGFTPSELNPEEANEDSGDSSLNTFIKRYGRLSETYDSPSLIPVVGVRGKDFPDYSFIPETNFICSDKEYIPGFYADIKSRCQVFHICWPDRVKSYLCPIGTTFNQRTLSCDYWYNSVCSHSPRFYYLNQELPQNKRPHSSSNTGFVREETSLPHQRMKFTPVRATTVYYSSSRYDSAYPEDEETEDYDSETSFPRYEKRPRYKRAASQLDTWVENIYKQAEHYGAEEFRTQKEKDYILRKMKKEVEPFKDLFNRKEDRANGLAYDPELANVKIDRSNGLVHDAVLETLKLARDDGSAYDKDSSQTRLDRSNDKMMKFARDNDKMMKFDRSGQAVDAVMAKTKLDRDNGLIYDPDLEKLNFDRNNKIAYDPDMAKMKQDRDNGLAYDPDFDNVKLDRDNGLAYDPDMVKGLMPFTKEMLATSYISAHKKKLD